MMRNTPPSWSVPVAVRDVPASGRSFDLVAGEGAREAAARAIGLRSLPRLEASFDVARHGREGLRVVGRVSATVGQTCVVSLEPIENEIEEKVDIIFEPQDPSAVAEEGGARLAVQDAPEPLIGGTIDLGVIATEFLTLGIDPYPRKAGAVFDAPADPDDSEHPFAGLAALRNGKP